jgi:hypothetical protein
VWRRVAVWAAVIGTLGLADWHLNKRHDGSTLSEATRVVFQVHTRPGRAAFLATWAGLAWWFAHHICAVPAAELD